MADEACPACHGARLNLQARNVKFDKTGIAEIAALSVVDVRRWIESLQVKGVLSVREEGIARDLIPEIRSRLEFLEEVGLGYLTLDRGAPTLSGGEAQRIRLAAQLGSNLQGVCYVLDEPTIGLHARDNQVLLNALHKLGGKGNTLVVVEHDEDTIRRADHIIDIGPSAGKRGGRLIAQGTAADISAVEESVTGRYLLNAMKHPVKARREVGKPRRLLPNGEGDGFLKLRGADLHNLRDIDVDIPLYRLVAVTGVSGSGKSTLARDVLLHNVQTAVQQRYTKAGRDADDKGKHPAWLGCKGLDGYQIVDRVLEVDQTPIGKTPRSCPATYIGFWDTIRKLFADTLEARARGYGPGRFSFNTGEGRCPTCEGQGLRTIGMSFLPDVKVPCESCHGARFNPETLAVTWRGKSIGDVLQMEVDEAVDFFSAMPNISHPLQLLKDVGLGLPDAGPAVAHAVGRRGAAHQAGDGAVQGARRHHAPRAEGAAHAVRAGRTDGGPAHGRRREAGARAAPAGGRRPQRDRDRARPGRDRRSRLGDRPGPRGRQRRRQGRGRRVAGGRGGARHAHRRRPGACAGTVSP